MLKMKSRVQLTWQLTMKDEVILENIKFADTFFNRLIGLMGKSKLNSDEGLIIRPCNSIHTFFMKFNIDVVFVDSDFIIVDVYLDLAPWKISKIYGNAEFVIEGKAGSLAKLKKGNQIKIVKKA